MPPLYPDFFSLFTAISDLLTHDIEVSFKKACVNISNRLCIYDAASRDWAVTVVFEMLQNTRRSNVMTEIVA